MQFLSHLLFILLYMNLYSYEPSENLRVQSAFDYIYNEKSIEYVDMGSVLIALNKLFEKNTQEFEGLDISIIQGKPYAKLNVNSILNKRKMTYLIELRPSFDSNYSIGEVTAVNFDELEIFVFLSLPNNKTATITHLNFSSNTVVEVRGNFKKVDDNEEYIFSMSVNIDSQNDFTVMSKIYMTKLSEIRRLINEYVDTNYAVKDFIYEYPILNVHIEQQNAVKHSNVVFSILLGESSPIEVVNQNSINLDEIQIQMWMAVESSVQSLASMEYHLASKNQLFVKSSLVTQRTKSKRLYWRFIDLQNEAQ